MLSTVSMLKTQQQTFYPNFYLGQLL